MRLTVSNEPLAGYLDQPRSRELTRDGNFISHLVTYQLRSMFRISSDAVCTGRRSDIVEAGAPIPGE